MLSWARSIRKRPPQRHRTILTGSPTDWRNSYSCSQAIRYQSDNIVSIEIVLVGTASWGAEVKWLELRVLFWHNSLKCAHSSVLYLSPTILLAVSTRSCIAALFTFRLTAPLPLFILPRLCSPREHIPTKLGLITIPELSLGLFSLRCHQRAKPSLCSSVKYESYSIFWISRVAPALLCEAGVHCLCESTNTFTKDSRARHGDQHMHVSCSFVWS